MQPPGKQPPPRIPYLPRTATGSQHNAGVRADVVRLGSGEGADYWSVSVRELGVWSVVFIVRHRHGLRRVQERRLGDAGGRLV
jgi:hypothetical protein